MGEKSLIKNEFFNLIKILINRAGGFILTILLARLLQPELFGLYSIVLSVVMILNTFIDLGMNKAFIYYISSALGENKKNLAAKYFQFIIKIKTILAIGFGLLLVVLSKTIALGIFNKGELTTPLIAGGFFLIFISLSNILSEIFIIKKDLKKLSKIESIYQIGKISVSVTLAIILSGINQLVGIFFGMGLVSLVLSVWIIYYIWKKEKYLFNKSNLEKIDKKKIFSFMGFITISSIGIVIMGSIDALMLGVVIEASYVGYYKIAIGIITSLSLMLSLSAVLLPIFSKLKEKVEFKRIIKKSARWIFIFTFPLIMGFIILGKEFIILIYGRAYISAIWPFYILLALLVVWPLQQIIISFFEGTGKPKKIAIAVIFTTILNIVLNYFLIKILYIKEGAIGAMIGAAIATVISRILLSGILIYDLKKELKFKMIKNLFYLNPFINSLIMGLILFLLKKIFNLTGYWKFILIPLGIIIYILTSLLTKSINLKEIKEIKNKILKK